MLQEAQPLGRLTPINPDIRPTDLGQPQESHAVGQLSGSQGAQRRKRSLEGQARYSEDLGLELGIQGRRVIDLRKRQGFSAGGAACFRCVLGWS